MLVLNKSNKYFTSLNGYVVSMINSYVEEVSKIETVSGVFVVPQVFSSRVTIDTVCETYAEFKMRNPLLKDEDLKKAFNLFVDERGEINIINWRRFDAQNVQLSCSEMRDFEGLTHLSAYKRPSLASGLILYDRDGRLGDIRNLIINNSLKMPEFCFDNVDTKRAKNPKIKRLVIKNDL